MRIIFLMADIMYILIGDEAVFVCVGGGSPLSALLWHLSLAVFQNSPVLKIYIACKLNFQS